MTSRDKEFNNLTENGAFGAFGAFAAFGRLLLIAVFLIAIALTLGQDNIYAPLTDVMGAMGENATGTGTAASAGIGTAASVTDAPANGAPGENVQAGGGAIKKSARSYVDGDAALRRLTAGLIEAGIYSGGSSPVMSLFISGSKPFSIFGGYADTRYKYNAGAGQFAIGADFFASPLNAGERNGETGGVYYGFPCIREFFSNLCAFSSEVAAEHQLLLDKRSESVSYARQLAAARHLSYSAYRIASYGREIFIQEHGESAAKLSEKDIAAKYDGDYFLERLEAMGFFRNDKYGKDINRRNAIIRAQSAFNMPITGKIDLETKRALIEGTDYVPRDFIEGAHPEGMWVVIDKSKRLLTVYVDCEVYAKYPVAVGKSISLTPEGQFTFVSKAKNPRWGGGGYAEPVAGGAPNNPLGKRWMGLSKGGGGQYGVHGNVSAYSIGTNASHGCVRMINSDVEEMYEYITIGTPVWIGTTDKLAEWGISQQLGSWAPELPNYLDYLPQTGTYAE